MKSSAIFIALVSAVSSNYAAAADHPNMLRGIIPAEILEMDCPGQTCNRRLRIAHFGCGSGNTCNFDGCCVPVGGGSTERRTDGSGSCNADNSSPDDFLTTEETEITCDCDEDSECDEGYSCKNKNKCGTDY